MSYTSTISIHSLRVEGDSVSTMPIFCSIISIHSLRVEGDDFFLTDNRGGRCISIHSLRVEGDPFDTFSNMCYNISIHSLRVEGDVLVYGLPASMLDFNPLPPCGGRLLSSLRPTIRSRYFNPLPPCGGRLQYLPVSPKLRYFNPLPPCGGRRKDGGSGERMKTISIHSLRVEGDLPQKAWQHRQPISIHSLRVEGDHRRCTDLE